MKLGIGEILLIIIVILFVIGPDKIPEFAKKFGEGLRAFRKATSGVTKEIRENVIDPLNEAAAPLKEAMEPINEMRTELNSLASGIQQDMQSLTNDLTKDVNDITGELNQTATELVSVAQGENKTPAKGQEPATEEEGEEAPVIQESPAEPAQKEEKIEEEPAASAEAGEPEEEPEAPLKTEETHTDAVTADDIRIDEETLQKARQEAERKVAEAEKALREAQEALTRIES